MQTVLTGKDIEKLEKDLKVYEKEMDKLNKELKDKADISNDKKEEINKLNDKIKSLEEKFENRKNEKIKGISDKDISKLEDRIKGLESKIYTLKIHHQVQEKLHQRQLHLVQFLLQAEKEHKQVAKNKLLQILRQKRETLHLKTLVKKKKSKKFAIRIS